jgi:hypothetical protein
MSPAFSLETKMNTIDFGGRLAIHPGEALYLVGYSRTLQGAKKTARNLIYRNAYPLPLTIVAGHQRVLVRDLMRLTGNEESVSLAAVAPPTPKRRSPGRPRKLATTVGAGHEQ